MKHQIKGIVTYLQISGGFWGIEGNDGKKWLPINMPEQLKVNGAQVVISAIDSDEESIYMWGEPIKIISFHTLPIL